MRSLEIKWQNALKETPPAKIEGDAKITYGADGRPTNFRFDWTKNGAPQPPRDFDK